MSTATTECSYWLVAPASRNLSSVHQLALAQAVGARIWISSFRVWTPSPAPSRSGRDSQTNFLPHAAEPVLGARVPAASAPGAGLRPFAGSRCSCRGRTRCCDEICAAQKSCIARAQLAQVCVSFLVGQYSTKYGCIIVTRYMDVSCCLVILTACYTVIMQPYFVCRADFSRAATRRDGVAELMLLSLLPLSVLPAGLFPNFRTENHAV
jgi:hypothetical protein